MKLIIDIPEYVYKACLGHRDIVYKYIANGIPYEERPQGEWIRSSNTSKKSYKRVCDQCHHISYFCGDGNYPNCPYCLADMSKGGTDKWILTQ